MFTKNVTLSLLIFLAIASLWLFVLPFKSKINEPLQAELDSLNEARNRYDQIDINSLKQKIAVLDPNQLRLLEAYVPKELRSGKLVYTLAQLAQQNKLNLKSIQYSIVDSADLQAVGAKKKLVIEFQMEGFYENFISWLKVVELSDTLVDIDSVRSAKVNNSSDVVAFNVKMTAYGISID